MSGCSRPGREELWSFQLSFPVGVQACGRAHIGCEMDGHKERAEEYRLKAEELRSLIPDMTDEHTRTT
jgi:hypothetical protein